MTLARGKRPLGVGRGEHQRAQRKLQRYDELVSNVEFLQEGAGTFPEEELAVDRRITSVL